MKYITKTAIPAGDNPFMHDSISVGLNLGNMLPTSDKRVSRLNDVYIMASGMNDLHDFYIVDKKTGERIGIKLDAIQPKTANYDLPRPEYGDVLDVSEFRSYVEDGSFIDYDGFGHPAKKIDGVTKMASNVINPSDHESTIPNDAEYIVWFNK